MAARTIVEHGTVALEGKPVPFKLVRVARRRNIHVLVDEDGELSVRAPWRSSIKHALEAIEEHRGWVLDTLESAATSRRHRPVLAPGAQLPLLDERLRLVVRMRAQLPLLPVSEVPGDVRVPAGLKISRRKKGKVYRNRDRLFVEVFSLKGGALRELLEDWFRHQAARLLPERVRRLAGVLGVTPNRLQIRGQKARWGSCSSAGDISLNWRLVLMPAELADYVLVHELCHLRHMDHSSDFWNLVASMIPDYRLRKERILKLQNSLVL